MKISDVKTFVLGTAWRNLTFVQVHTDDGLVGVGEVRMLNHTDALLGYLAEAVPNHVLGADPFNVEDLVRRMFRALPRGPGLRVRFDPGVIEAHPRRLIFFNLFAEDWHRRQAERQGLPA